MRKLFYFLSFFISLMFFAGCSLFESVSDTTSKLQILLPGNARSIEDSVSVYEIKISNPVLEITETGKPGQLVTISEIPTGIYDVSAVAKDSLGNIAGVGTATAEIMEGATSNVSISMSAYTVTVLFNYNDGDVSHNRTASLEYGSLVERPVEDPVKTGCTFLGWGLSPEATEFFDFDTPVTAPIVLHAVWDDFRVSTFAEFQEEFTAERNSRIVVTADLEITSTVTSGDIPSFLTVPSGCKKEIIGLTGNETLSFVSTQNASCGIEVNGELSFKNIKVTTPSVQFLSKGMLYVSSGGSVKIEVGTTISGFNVSGRSYSAPIVVDGYLTMNGGAITSNEGHRLGGAVCIKSSAAQFTMNGGSISSNRNTSGGVSDEYDGNGGAVRVESGKFIFNGGAISNNTSLGYNPKGGGVYVSSNGSFVNAGGTFVGNTATLGPKYYVCSGGRYGTFEGAVMAVTEDTYE